MSGIYGGIQTTQLATLVPLNPAISVIEFLKYSSNENMLVDGTTPKIFSYSPAEGVIVAVNEILLVFSVENFVLDGESFGSIAKLTNGIKIESNVSSTIVELFNIKQNEDFFRIPGRAPILNNMGAKEMVYASFLFSGLVRLTGTSDDMRITIRDDLTSNLFKYLTATLYGVVI